MLTLTTAAVINTILGGTTTVPYDKMVLDKILLEPISGDVRADVVLTATSDPNMTPIRGGFRIVWATKTATLTVQQLDFFKSGVLSGAQQAAVVTIVQDAQNALEAGLVSVGFADGVQSTGI